MQGLRTGLRHRLRRAHAQIGEQHRALGKVARELEAALEARSPARTAEWLERFSEALRAHFDLEDSVLFPALHGLTEDTSSELQRLSEEHALFLETLERVLASLRGGSTADPSPTLVALRERLAEHERQEERLLVRVLDAQGDD